MKYHLNKNDVFHIKFSKITIRKKCTIYLFYIRKFIKHFQTSNFMLENQLQINKKYCNYTLNYFSECLFYKYKIQFNNR